MVRADWAMGIRGAQRIPATASTGTTQRQSHSPVGSGKRGMAMRRKPYAPVLPIMPANVTSIGTGAAAYASGTHEWHGNSGVLIANAIANSPNRPNWMAGEAATDGS